MFSRLWVQTEKLLSRDGFQVYTSFVSTEACPFQRTLAKNLSSKFKCFFCNFKGKVIAIYLNNNEPEFSLNALVSIL